MKKIFTAEFTAWILLWNLRNFRQGFFLLNHNFKSSIKNQPSKKSQIEMSRIT